MECEEFTAGQKALIRETARTVLQEHLATCPVKERLKTQWWKTVALIGATAGASAGLTKAAFALLGG